jgi:hypothetical protein
MKPDLRKERRRERRKEGWGSIYRRWGESGSLLSYLGLFSFAASWMVLGHGMVWEWSGEDGVHGCLVILELASSAERFAFHF